VSTRNVQPKKEDHWMDSTPRVSVGVPVRNGERFLTRQLDSLLAQDFRDFEIVISDNGSTDQTEAICRGYAAADSRIRYHRSDEDRGLAWNHNRTFELSRAPFFKWAAYDDEHEPTYLSKAMAVLERDESVVCCHSASVEIDERGVEGRVWPARPRTASPAPHVRLNEMLRPHPVDMMYGVMRADVLAHTGLHRPFPDSDHALLAELALLGRLVELEDTLFRRRRHGANGAVALPTSRSKWAHFAGGGASKRTMPGWPLNREMVRIVRESNTRGLERLLCWRALTIWALRKAPRHGARGLEKALTAVGREDAAPYVRRPRQLVAVLRAGKASSARS
jgi:glycosyltransferase involved in cell wall biosynthesis